MKKAFRQGFVRLAGGRARHRERTSQSASQTAPLIGEPLAGQASPAVRLGSNWAQGSGPCSHWQRLRNYALPKSAGQAVVNRDSGDQSFPIAKNFARPARPPPTRQWLPYQGSWREAPERLYQGTLSSKNRLLSQARLRSCTPCRFTVAGRQPFVQPLRHLR